MSKKKPTKQAAADKELAQIKDRVMVGPDGKARVMEPGRSVMDK